MVLRGSCWWQNNDGILTRSALVCMTLGAVNAWGGGLSAHKFLRAGGTSEAVARPEGVVHGKCGE